MLSRRNVFLAGVVAMLLLPSFANPYALFIGTMLSTYVILAVGLNLLVGYAGQLAFANAAMYGIGAYTCGLLQVKLGVSYWLALPAGALVAMAIGSVMAVPALRLSGLYLALATLAFAQFAQWVFLNWETVTYGAGGFKVPEVSFAWAGLSSPTGVFYLALALALALYLVAANVVRSPLGRAFVAIRDGEVAAESLGVDLLRYKAIAFAMSGFYAGTAGGLYCAAINFVAPEGYDLFQMVLHKAMVVVGGIGSVAGSVIGATLLVTLLELLREFKSTQEIAFGALLLAFVIFMPDGVVSLLKSRLKGWDEPLRRLGDEPAPTPAPAAEPAEDTGRS
jgi:branched-chain amino acid transport system permease protein